MKRSYFASVLWMVIAAVICWAGDVAYAQPTTAPLLSEGWNLQVAGSPRRIWYAVSSLPPLEANSPHTYIRSRAVQEDWKELVDFPNRVLSMTSNGTELLLSMEGGEWALVIGEQFLSGPPLPGRADIVALTADPQSVWAVGWAHWSLSTTAPTMAPSDGPVITSRPSSSGDWGLFRLDKDHWNLVSRLPHSLPAGADAQFGMTAVNHVPVVGYRASPKEVALLQLDGENWKSLGTINWQFPIRKISLLNMDERLMAWVVADKGVGELFVQNSGAWKGKPLQFTATFEVIDSAIAVFNGELRLLAIGSHEQFQEQRYDAAGQPIGNVTAVETPPAANEITTRDLLNWSVLGLLIIITLASAQQGYGLKEVKVADERVVLAPLSLRLAAGLIDFWPLYLMVFLVFGRHHRSLVPSELQNLDRFTIWSVVICLALYLLHPLIGELVWGRSLGKMFVGLRVMGDDGKPAGRGAIVLRNLLRVIEGPLLLCVPFLAIYFTPMRQRIGDMIAGTMVVARSAEAAK